MNLDNLSLDELRQLADEVNAAIVRHEQRRKVDARLKLEATAKALGYTLSEIIGEPSKATKRSPAAIKYRHPSNETLTWTGRGRQPRWVQEALNSGRSLSDLLV